MANGRSRGMGRRAAKIALMTALQESALKMYANETVPESLKYPHDAVGKDHDSLNYFQQRLTWGGPGPVEAQVKNLMNDDYAINAFYGTLAEKVPDYNTRPLGQAAQEVQRSAYPDAYDKWEATAEALLTEYY